MKRVVVALLAVAFVVALSASPAMARKQYKDEFDTKYVKKDSTDPKEKALADAVATAKCQICHGKNDEGAEDKKIRNSYGEAIGKITGKNQKDKEKIGEALDKVAGEKSDPSKADSPTFGDLIKQGKLPAGN